MSGEEKIKLKLSKKLATVLQVMAKEVMQMSSEESSEESASKESGLGKRAAPSKTKKPKQEKAPKIPKSPRVARTPGAPKIAKVPKSEILYKKGKFNKTVEILPVDLALENTSDDIPEDLSTLAYT